jgi:hypothetical protein
MKRENVMQLRIKMSSLSAAGWIGMMPLVGREAGIAMQLGAEQFFDN